MGLATACGYGNPWLAPVDDRAASTTSRSAGYVVLVWPL